METIFEILNEQKSINQKLLIEAEKHNDKLKYYSPFTIFQVEFQKETINIFGLKYEILSFLYLNRPHCQIFCSFNISSWPNYALNKLIFLHRWNYRTAVNQKWHCKFRLTRRVLLSIKAVFKI